LRNLFGNVPPTIKLKITGKYEYRKAKFISS
jgi:hypothetical protein